MRQLKAQILRILVWTSLALSTYYIVCFFALALLRLYYPYHIDWIEGALVDQSIRILEGKPLYTSPSLTYVPLFYPPLYFYTGAIFLKVFGLGFHALRLVGIVSSAISFVIIYLIVYRETRYKIFGIISVGLFAATYKLSGSWMDLARIDSLFLCLFVSALYFLRFDSSWKGSLIAGALFSLAFLTKQTALVMFFPMLIFAMLFRHKKNFLLLLFVVLAGVGGTSLIFNRLSNGWYYYFVFELPKLCSGLILEERWVTFWTEDILKPIGLSFLLGCAYLFFLKTPHDITKTENKVFYGCLLFGVLAGAWITRLHEDGGVNVLMPVYAGTAILTGISVSAPYASIQNPLFKDIKSNARLPYPHIVLILIVIQLVSLLYNPIKRVPTANDLQDGQRLLDAMSSVQGSVYAPRYGYLPRLVGKAPFAHEANMRDIIKGDPQRGGMLLAELKAAIKERRFGAILFESKWVKEDIDLSYPISEPVVLRNSKFWAPDEVTSIKRPKSHPDHAGPMQPEGTDP